MKLYEIAVQYNEELNPKLWDGYKLKSDVRDKLVEIAEAFIEALDVKFEMSDLILTGSAANYNWTSKSDIDLHLVTDLEAYKEACPEFAEDFFKDKKSLFNDNHDIEIHGLPVEVYVQDENEPHVSSGVYSIMEDKWLVKPEYDPPKDVDEAKVKEEAAKWKKRIDKLTATMGNHEQGAKLKDEIREYRKKGLDGDGEFSVENLVFKELRNSGYMKKLIDYGRDSLSDELSL